MFGWCPYILVFITWLFLPSHGRINFGGLKFTKFKYFLLNDDDDDIDRTLE